MSTYIHFTEEQKERAAAVDLEAFLRHRGEKLITSGRDKRLASDHSITIRGNEWFDHATCKGGHAISFVQTYMRVSYPEAVTLLLGGEIGAEYPRASERKEEPPKPFELPEANKDVRRVFAYLMKNRQIERNVVSHFVKEKVLYEDAQYHNAVFVGTDEDGIPRHAHKRSTNSYGKAFRINIEGSDPRHSFHHIGTDGSLYVFEDRIEKRNEIGSLLIGREGGCSGSSRAEEHRGIELLLGRLKIDKKLKHLVNDLMYARIRLVYFIYYDYDSVI